MAKSPIFLLSFICISVCISVCFCADPDDSRNVTQVIQARGYPVEDHYVVTSDGFVLSLQRITGQRNSPGSPTVSKPAVLLQHGLLDNSFTWVANQVVEQCLAFILADAGYDVWLSNARGNTYSNTNVHYKPSQKEFWEWSYDEMASIDLPTVLSYILGVTRQPTLSYVGHSQGTIMGFIGFENPEIAKYVNVFVALAPVAWVHNCKSILLDALADTDAEVLVELLGVKDFAPDSEISPIIIHLFDIFDFYYILKILLPAICSKTPDACGNILGLVMGWDTTNLNASRIPVILAHEPSGTSMQNIDHWAQGVKKEEFQAYDYGSAAANKKHYNQTTPPVYDPSLITIPTAIFYGGNDDLADPPDVQHLIPLLKNLVLTHFEPSYSHLDFVWGVNAYTNIYPQVLQLIQQYDGIPKKK